MRALLFFFCAVVAAVCVPSIGTAQENALSGADRRVALVIGVGAYQNVPALPNPANDASAAADAFRRLGFDVHEQINPTRASLERAIERFLAALTGADVGLVFYAGHSIQINAVNYLIPADARLHNAEDIARFFINMDELSELIAERARVRVVILDACRDNPFLQRVETVSTLSGLGLTLSRGLAPISGSEQLPEGGTQHAYGSVVAYAASAGRTASDGFGAHSPFTQALLRHVEEPGLEIGTMFRRIAASVIAETGETQHPEYLVRLTGDLYFSQLQPLACDFLAAAPYNATGIESVEFDRIDTARAIPACEEAVAQDPDHSRYLYYLGRSVDAAGQYERAVDLYRRSSELGHPYATSSLGAMYINGQGVEQDFRTGVDFLLEARRLGSRDARVSLTTVDFSVLFLEAEYRRLQEELASRGHYSGSIDGVDGPGLRAAIAAYQQANGYAQNGVTLETLDGLSLVEIIPHYDVN